MIRMENERLYQYALDKIHIPPLARLAASSVRGICRAMVCCRAGFGRPSALRDEASLYEALESIYPRPPYVPMEPVEAPQGEAVDVSVLIPAYNVEDYIAGALDAVLAQKADYSYEVVVVNDGSTDGTKGILDAFEGRSGLRIIHQENGGSAAARNTAVRASRGRYLIFVDADDALLPDAIQHLIRRAEETGADMVQGGWRYLNDDGSLGETQRFPEAVYTRDQFINAIGFPGTPWAKAYRRELMDGALCPPSFNSFVDTNIKMLVFPRARVFATTGAMTYAWRRNPKGITFSSARKKRSLQTYWIVEDMLKRAEALAIPRDSLYLAILLKQLGPVAYKRLEGLDEDVQRVVFELSCRLVARWSDVGGDSSLPWAQRMALRAFTRRDFSLWRELGRLDKVLN